MRISRLHNLLWISLLSLVFIECNSPTSSKTQPTEEAPAEIQSDEKSKVIVFFGNSLTAGYGLEEGEDFPSLIQNKIDSLDLNYTVVNAGLSGETTAGGVNRIDWILNQQMDVFVLELGANDMLRGFDLTSTENNLNAIVEKVKVKNPNIQVVIAGMQAPPNLGADYTTSFQMLYTKIAEKHNSTLIPFLLEGVAGQKSLNLDDGIHPNTEGQKIVAKNVWKALSTIL